MIAGVVVALASCSQADEMPGQPQEDGQLVTFNIQTPAATRATVTGLTRYIVEAYEGSTATGNPAARVEAATGTLVVELEKNTEYTFLFWADKGTAENGSTVSSGYWDTADLKAVEVASGKESAQGEVAYCLVTTLNTTNLTSGYAVELRNATAQMNFVEKTGVSGDNNTLIVSYATGAMLNVGTGKVTEGSTFAARTFANIGPASAGAILATDYILAPKGEQRLLSVTIKFNSEDMKSLTNVPFQQCYKTNITGEYAPTTPPTPPTTGDFTFTITADDTWDTPDNELYLNYPATVEEAKAILGTEVEGENESIGLKHVFNISTADQLRALHVLMANLTKLNYGSYGYRDATYKLTADIDLGNTPWIPIGSGGLSFRGEFDGQGQTVSGLNVSGSWSEAGFFANSGTIRNLRVKGSVTGSSLIGGIVGDINGKMAFCSFEGTLTATNNNEVRLGGIIGLMSVNPTITACFANTTQIVSGSHATLYQGGIIGRVMPEKPTIKGCTWNYNSTDGTGLEKGYMGDDTDETNMTDNAAFDGTNLAARIAAMNNCATDDDAYRWEADGDNSVKLVPKSTN